MAYAARAAAIVTGLVASVSVAISVIWWFDPAFGHKTGTDGVVIAFGTGLLGFFVMFVLLMVQMEERGRGRLAYDLIKSLFR